MHTGLKTVFLTICQSLHLVSGLNWTTTHRGQQFVNIHLDSDHVTRPCLHDTTVCVPITYSLLFCNLLNSADSDVEIQVILRKQSCGFVLGEPMICCPYLEVSEKTACDLGDQKSKDMFPEASKDKFKELLNRVPVCGKRSDRNLPRIAGGKDAPPGDWPWMVQLYYAQRRSRKPIFECAGTLISLKDVLTSAHCLDQRKVVEVRLGETDLATTLDCLDLSEKPSCVCDEQCPFSSEEDCLAAGQCAHKHILRGVARQATHPQYDFNTWEYDIGMVTLDRPVYITDYIRPVCLPVVPGELGTGRDNLWFVTGWGTTTADSDIQAKALQQVQVDIIKRRDCSNEWGVEVLSSQLCAAGTEEGSAVCQGDSGGPLVTRNRGVWEQGAVVSSGSSICGDTKPSFFTLINQETYKWIVDNMDGRRPKRP